MIIIKENNFKLPNWESRKVIIDTETTGLNKMSDVPFMLQFSFLDSEEIYCVEFCNKLSVFLNDNIAKAKSLIFHNGKFDLHMFKNANVNLNQNFAVSEFVPYCFWLTDFELLNSFFLLV